MSPAQVAQTVGASRRTIMRAIEAQELMAFRDNRNHWKITAQAVEQWALAQCAPTGQVPTFAQSDQVLAHPLPTPENGAEELKVEREGRRLAEVEAAELRGKLVATEAERDRLHSIIQGLTTQQTKRRSWWPWKRS